MTRDEIVKTMAKAVFAKFRVEDADPPKISFEEHAKFFAKSHHAVYLDAVRVCLAALEAKGLAVVPVEPTDAMLEAGDDGHYGMSAKEVWSAMLTAASHAGTGGCGSEQRERVANPNPHPKAQ